MYFSLEEARLSEGVCLTELTWSYRLNRTSFDSHYPIRHPGAAEVDQLLMQMDPSYQPPQRYSNAVIAEAFMTDYRSLPKGTLIYGTSIDQCLALEQYLAASPLFDGACAGSFRVMNTELTHSVVRGMLESLAGIRTRALGGIS